MQDIPIIQIAGHNIHWSGANYKLIISNHENIYVAIIYYVLSVLHGLAWIDGIIKLATVLYNTVHSSSMMDDYGIQD